MLDNSNGKPATVGIVGLGYYTLTVADLCADAGWPVEFAVDDREGADGDPCGAAFWMGVRGIRVLSTAEFVERARGTPDGLTLVAGHLNSDTSTPLSGDSFARAAEWVRRTAGSAALLHPAALLARVPPRDCPNRYAVLGFPGSGNILTQNLVEGLYARRPSPVPAAWAMRASLTEHFFHTTVARIRDLLAPLSPTHVDFIPHEFGTMLVTVERGPDRAGIAFYVPSHRHLGLPQFTTHSRPTRQALDYFASVNAPCVAVMRHPLETLLSQANKIARPSKVMLDHPRFLDRAAAQLADYTEHLLANRHRVYVTRYEDLAARRIDELRRLADWLELPVSEAEAGDLFDQFLNRNLPSSVPTHFFRGGSDKWRGEFEPPHLRRALRHLPAEAFTAFGYEVPTEADLSPAPLAGKPSAPNARHAVLLESFPFHRVPGRHGIQVTGTDAETVAGLMTAFQDRELIALLDAGGLTADARRQPGNEPATA